MFLLRYYVKSVINFAEIDHIAHGYILFGDTRHAEKVDEEKCV